MGLLIPDDNYSYADGCSCTRVQLSLTPAVHGVLASSQFQYETRLQKIPCSQARVVIALCCETVLCP